MTRKNMCEDPLEPGPLSFPQLSMPPQPPASWGGRGGMSPASAFDETTAQEG